MVVTEFHHDEQVERVRIEYRLVRQAAGPGMRRTSLTHAENNFFTRSGKLLELIS
jgi:hypothetical protein